MSRKIQSLLTALLMTTMMTSMPVSDWLATSLAAQCDYHRRAAAQHCTPTLSFSDNFGKYEPILIVLSLLDSAMNCGKSYYIIRHLTSNVLLHYLVKFEFSTVQLYMTVIQFKSVADRLFTVNIHRKVVFSVN